MVLTNPQEIRREQTKLKRLLQAEEKAQRENKFLYFRPQEWQSDMIRRTAEYQEVAAFKANRIGGSLVSCKMASVWSTGLYDVPRRTFKGDEWKWNGRRFDYPTRGVIVTPDNDQARGAMQRLLIGPGPKDRFGIGPVEEVYPILPYDRIVDVAMSREVAGLIDFITVKFRDTDDLSYIYIKSQNQDPMTVAGDEFDWVIFDEFPKVERWYSQMIARIQTRDGIIFVSATPEQDDAAQMMCINRFLKEKPKTPDGVELTSYKFVHLREAEHFNQTQYERMVASYPERERIFRVEGKPFIGSGFIYAAPDEDLRIKRSELPNHKNCFHICGLDWGRSDWGALVWVMIENGIYYVWDMEKIKVSPREAADIIRGRDRIQEMHIPVAWGHDAGNREGTSETSIVNMLEEYGVNVINQRAHNAFQNDDSNAIWPGIHYLQDLMAEKRVKIVDDTRMTPLWDEKRMYYVNKDGQIPKKKETRFDLLDAMRYAFMMDEYAEPWGRKDGYAEMVTMDTSGWNPLGSTN